MGLPVPSSFLRHHERKQSQFKYWGAGRVNGRREENLGGGREQDPHQRAPNLHGSWTKVGGGREGSLHLHALSPCSLHSCSPHSTAPCHLS